MVTEDRRRYRGPLMDIEPLLSFKSYNKGAPADVAIYADRVEWNLDRALQLRLRVYTEGRLAVCNGWRHWPATEARRHPGLITRKDRARPVRSRGSTPPAGAWYADGYRLATWPTASACSTFHRVTGWW